MKKVIARRACRGPALAPTMSAGGQGLQPPQSKGQVADRETSGYRIADTNNIGRRTSWQTMDEAEAVGNKATVQIPYCHSIRRT